MAPQLGVTGKMALEGVAALAKVVPVVKDFVKLIEKIEKIAVQAVTDLKALDDIRKRLEEIVRLCDLLGVIRLDSISAQLQDELTWTMNRAYGDAQKLETTVVAFFSPETAANELEKLRVFLDTRSGVILQMYQIKVLGMSRTITDVPHSSTEVPHAAELFVNVISGRCLKNVDWGRLVGDVSDPYVRVTFGGMHFDTEYILNNLNPSWNFQCSFPFDKTKPRPQMLRLEVFDWSKRWQHKSLGSFTLDVMGLTPGKANPYEKNLEKGGKGELKFEVSLHPAAAGPGPRSQSKWSGSAPDSRSSSKGIVCTLPRTIPSDSTAEHVRKQKFEDIFSWVINGHNVDKDTFGPGDRVEAKHGEGWYEGVVKMLPQSDHIGRWTIQCDVDPQGEVVKCHTNELRRPEFPLPIIVYLPQVLHGVQKLQGVDGSADGSLTTWKIINTSGFGLAYRIRKDFDAKLVNLAGVKEGMTVQGIDDGDGWVRVLSHQGRTRNDYLSIFTHFITGFKRDIYVTGDMVSFLPPWLCRHLRSPNFEENCRKQFKYLDTNGSQSLDAAEFKKLGAISECFHLFDLTSDGKIEILEFIYAKQTVAIRNFLRAPTDVGQPLQVWSASNGAWVHATVSRTLAQNAAALRVEYFSASCTVKVAKDIWVEDLAENMRLP